MSIDPFNVPCNGCTLCCKGDAVRLLPGDDKTKWATVPHASMPGELMLAHKPNGDCFYLGESGCTIHGDKPLMCMEMDCRRIASALSFTQARKFDRAGRLPIAVWQRGRSLLKETGK